MSRGLEVFGIDAAEGMIEIARRRGVEAKPWRSKSCVRWEDVFDGAISNFGALNCVADLGELSKTLARLIRPQGKLALCVMSRSVARRLATSSAALVGARPLAWHR